MRASRGGGYDGMAEFLRTSDVSARLESIIVDARQRLVLISPYLQVSDNLKERIESRVRSGIDVHIMYRELKAKEDTWLDSMPSVRTSSCKNLHAKCYWNEREALLTSMNLYQFSQVNNFEMGVLVSSERDPELYRQIVEESEHIIEVSEKVRIPSKSVAKIAERSREYSAAKRTRESTRATPTTPQQGFCIRCKDDLPANPLRRYCEPHYKTWKRYGNPEYEEKHCHTCGREHTATMDKPVCIECYRKYRNVFEPAAG